MWVIRREQMAVFEAVQDRMYEKRLIALLRGGGYGEVEGLSEGELLGLIRRSMDAAHEHGIEDYEDVTRFIEYVISFGEDFGCSPQTAWAGEILASEDLDAREKLDLVDAEVARRLTTPGA